MDTGSPATDQQSYTSATPTTLTKLLSGEAMATRSPIDTNRTSIRFFGRSAEPKQAAINPSLDSKATTAWEIYNQQVFPIDREQTKDWNDNLNTLLIFVCTPFIPYFFLTPHRRLYIPRS
jgi:hypothetical protein